MDDAHTLDDFPPTAGFADLRLLHLADSAFPIGALAHSFGLETLVEHGLLTAATLADFLAGYIEESGTLETVFCLAAVRLGGMGVSSGFASEWLALNAKLSARKPARESREGSGSLGRNFLAAVLALEDSRVLRQAMQSSREAAELIHHSTAFGLACGALDISEGRAAMTFLHQSVAALISAAQRLMPLGQSAAAAILWNLKPMMLETLDGLRGHGIDDVTSFSPLLDWGAMEHPSLTTRLFIS